MLKKIGLSLAALVAAVGIAFAGGAFQGFPLVGGDGTQCLSNANPSSAQTCNQFWPAGPGIVTGNETFPADTNSQGAGSQANPSTVDIPIAAMGAGPYVYEAPLTGVSITIANTTRRLIIEPAGTIATHTVVLPVPGAGFTALVDNQLFGLCSTQIITALTMTAGAGTTLLNGLTATTVPTTVGVASCAEWVYRKSNTTWYRVQ
jgi:hypothetical protein